MTFLIITRRKLVILDPHGKIFYDTNTIMNSGIIAVLGENVSEAYLTHLRENDISYLFAGADGHDLESAMEQIGTLFNIERIVLEGGGIVNGQFLKHGLIDEFSLMIYPGIDGLAGIHSIVEYTGSGGEQPAAGQSLELISADKLENGVIWLYYRVHRKTPACR